jgi:hypothetical protein
MDEPSYILSAAPGIYYAGPDKPERFVDDPGKAMLFESAAQAWRAAKQLEGSPAEHAHGGPVVLHLYDGETGKISRLTDTGVPEYVLRPFWRDVLKTPLPLDIPAPAQGAEEVKQRLSNFLQDTDWSNARSWGGGSFGFDPSFWIEADKIFRADAEEFRRLWRSAAPADIPPPDLSDPRWRATLDAAQTKEETNEVVEAKREPATGPAGETRAQPDRGLPAYVARHFVEAGGGFYYKQRPDVKAFSVRGRSFVAHDNSVMTATAIVEMAQQRGWSALRVSGTKDFRRAVWAAAMERGLRVTGYSPSHGETALLAQSASPDGHPSRPSRESRKFDSGRSRDPALTGVIVDMGAAPYQHDSDNSQSFYVTLRDRDGNEQTRWGVGLQQAIERSGATVGQRVRLERLGTLPVEVDRTVRDDKGDVSYRTPEVVQRRLWEVHVLDRTQEVAQNGSDTNIQVTLSKDPQLAKALELIEQRLPQLPPEQREEFRRHFDTAYARLSRAPARDRASPALSKSARGR